MSMDYFTNKYVRHFQTIWILKQYMSLRQTAQIKEKIKHRNLQPHNWKHLRMAPNSLITGEEYCQFNHQSEQKVLVTWTEVL
jgi:hypothetical protein